MCMCVYVCLYVSLVLVVQALMLSTHGTVFEKVECTEWLQAQYACSGQKYMKMCGGYKCRYQI